ncbi:MAG: hypothetical protein RL638_430, partial [Bacteroidota bacterium]
MKKFLLGFCLFAVSYLSQGQTKSLNYQAVIMDPKPIEIPGTPITGQPLKNGKVTVRFTLLSKSGSVDYEEFHQTTTDEFGLINLSIGAGLIGGASGISTQSTTATYRTFDAIKWDSNVKQLRVDLSFDTGKTFSTASVQPFNYMAYSLYAESVEYKNVRESPTTLSYFNNDVGYIIPKDLDPMKREIVQNKEDADTKFLVVNQALTDNEKVVTDNTKKINDINTTIAEHGGEIVNHETRITYVTERVVVTEKKLEEVANTFENYNNKSANIQSDGTSDTKYPSVKAVKQYVDQATQGIALQTTVDGKEDKQNKSSNIKTDANPNYNYPTVAAVKQFVAESALSADAQLVIDGKENVSNKSTNVVTDAGSNDKYPTVKAIKQYVDETTLGKNLAADINAKEEKSNKADVIKQDEKNGNLYPTVLAVRQFVNDATINSLTVEKQSIAMNDSKNVISLKGGESESSITLPNASNTVAGLIQLKGDLAGTSDAPTVPELANKENAANKTNEIKSDETNANLFPTVLAVSKFVKDATINSLTVEKQSISLNDAKNVITLSGGDKPSSITLPNASSTDAGLIQLKGDLSGSYDAPEIKANAITTAKILDENVTDAKIKSLSSSKLTGEVSLSNGGTGASTKDGARENLGINLVDNTSDANKPVSIAAQAELDKKESLSNKTSDFVKDADSETKYPTIKSVKNYIDTKAVSNEGLVEAEKVRAIAAENTKEDLVNKSTNILSDKDSDIKYPSVKSVVEYAYEEVDKERKRAIGRENGIGDEISAERRRSFDKDTEHENSIANNKSSQDAKNVEIEGKISNQAAGLASEKTEREAAIVAEKNARESAISAEKADREAALLAAKNAQDAKNNNLDSKIAAHETAITNNKSAQDSKNTEIDGKLNNQATALATEKSDRETAISGESAARLAGLAAEKADREKAIASLTLANGDVKSALETERAAREAAISAEKTEREAAILAQKTAQDTKNADIDSKIDAHETKINNNKSAQDSKNTEIDGKLASQASALAQEKMDREAALAAEKSARESAVSAENSARVAALASEKAEREAALLAEKLARETAINLEKEARVAGLASEKSNREAALLAAKSVQDTKNSEIDGKLTSNAAAITTEKSDREAAVLAEKTARESAISTESAARVAGLASEKSNREAALLAAKSVQDTKNSEIDGKLTSNAAAITTEK